MDISVIIPTLNEEANLPLALDSLPPEVEVIISDGQSRDSTADVARKRGARVVEGSPGRGAQMNRGVSASTGPVLLFLHADCTLGPTAFETVRTALRNTEVVGGSFQLRISHPNRRHRLLALGSNLRARLGLPYGDQALFVRRGVFDAVGGYPEIPIMEDVELVRRLRRQGKLVVVDETVTTSSRHWDELGPGLTTILNWVTVFLYFLGVSPSRLAPMYHRLLKRGRTHQKESVTGCR
jgi:rSAM/selenodomain-associated transferase 2